MHKTLHVTLLVFCACILSYRCTSSIYSVVLFCFKDVHTNCFNVHPYCACNLCRNAMLCHTGTPMQRKKSVHMKGWYPLR